LPLHKAALINTPQRQGIAGANFRGGYTAKKRLHSAALTTRHSVRHAAHQLHSQKQAYYQRCLTTRHQRQHAADCNTHISAPVCVRVSGATQPNTKAAQPSGIGLKSELLSHLLKLARNDKGGTTSLRVAAQHIKGSAAMLVLPYINSVLGRDVTGVAACWFRYLRWKPHT
jgi:hypothetical protein